MYMLDICNKGNVNKSHNMSIAISFPIYIRSYYLNMFICPGFESKKKGKVLHLVSVSQSDASNDRQCRS